MTCEGCGRTFRSEFVFRRHAPVTLGRCRTDAELRRIGVQPNRRGEWCRLDPNAAVRQLRLFSTRGRPRKRPEILRDMTRGRFRTSVVRWVQLTFWQRQGAA